MNQAYPSLVLLSVLALQSGCGAGSDEKAAPAKPISPEPPKTVERSTEPGIGGQPAKAAMPEHGKITLALAPPGDPDRVQAGAPLDLVCHVTADPSGPEPDTVIFDVSGTVNKRRVSFGSIGVKNFKRQDRTLSFTGRLEAPKPAGSYVVTARVFGVDPAVPGPQLAPAADGTQVKAGARVEFPAPPPLKIKVIVGKGPV